MWCSLDRLVGGMSSKVLPPRVASTSQGNHLCRAARPRHLPKAAAPAAQAFEGQQHDGSWMHDGVLTYPNAVHPSGAVASCSGNNRAPQLGPGGHQGRRSQQQHQCGQPLQPAVATDASTSARGPRMLTAKITLTVDVSSLLRLLKQSVSCLDAIHVSAASKHACRVLGLQLQVPLETSAYAAQQEVQQDSVLLWLRQLQMQLVATRLQQLNVLHQQIQPLEAQQQLQHSSYVPQCTGCEQQSREQQQQQQQREEQQQPEDQQQHNIQWVIQQQLEPHNMVQQQLSEVAAAGCQEQCDNSTGLPVAVSDSWVLLLHLSQLVHQHASSMGSQQLCTCLNSLTYVLLQHPSLPLLAVQPYRAALQQLLQSAQQQLRNLQPKALALVLHSAAAVARSPYGMGLSDRFMKKWYCYSNARMDEFSALDLSMSAWALGRLQLYPPSQWMAEFWTHSKVAALRMGAQELVMLLVGVALVEPVPRLSATAAAARSGWLPLVAEQLQQHLLSMTPKQLSAVMLAMARLKHQPTRAWQQVFEQAWDKQQSQFTAAGHSAVLWGIGCMPHSVEQQEPRIAWARKVQHALQAAVSKPASAVAAVAIMKLRQAAHQQQRQHLVLCSDVLQPQPPVTAESQQQQQGAKAQATLVTSELSLQQSSPQLQAQPEQPQLLASASLLHPTDCAMTISGLAHLGPAAMDSEFASFWLRQSRSQLGNMNSEELSVCLQSLGRLRLRPPEDWLQQAMACCAQQAACMSHQQLAMVLWGCARLQYMPNVLVTAELLMSAAEQLPSFSSHSLSLLVWSLGLLRLKPNKEWMQLMLKQAQARFRRSDRQDLYCLLSGLYRLRYKPGEQWLHSYAKALANKVHIISPSNHHKIVALLKAIGYSCEDKPYAWVMDEAAVAAMCDRGTSRIQQQGA